MRSFRATLLSFLAVLLMGGASVWAQQATEDRGFSITLMPTDRQNTRFDLHALNERAFRNDFRIQLLDASDRDALQNATIYAADGRVVAFRTGVPFKGETFILGTTQGDRTLIVSSVDEPDGKMQVTFSAVDRNGKFIQNLSRGEVMIFDNKGRQSCFDFQQIKASSVQMSVGIAIDVSGSMGGYESELNRVIGLFMNQMPDQAYCSVIEFDHEYRVLVGGGSPKRCSRVRGFAIRSPGGGTSIFPALKKLYEMVSAQNSGLNLVLVVSDGASGNEQLQEALQAKGKTTTFVNWLGHYSKTYSLAQFADAEVFGAVGKDGTLSEFFTHAGSSLRNQFVATQCR